MLKPGKTLGLFTLIMVSLGSLFLLSPVIFSSQNGLLSKLSQISIVKAADPSQATASISAVPASGNYNQGDTFTAVIHIDGGGQSFNAASATISVSSNLSIQSVSTAINSSATGCNFSFVPLSGPTKDNPSFSGAILSNQSYPAFSKACDVMTLTLQANSGGTGTLNIDNGDIESYPAQPSDPPLDIYSSVITGSYPITGSSNPPDNNNNSSSTPSSPAAPSGCSKSADLDGNGKVNILDLSVMLRNWGRQGSPDLDCNGVVNVLDLSILLRAWSK